MTLKALINVLDGDTFITVTYKYEDIFKGLPSEFDGLEHIDKEVKCVWYSRIYNTLMIEI